MKQEVTQPIKGLNTDIHPINLDGSTAYTFALNARQESEDGGQVNLTNEPSNTIAVSFPEGYSVIGVKNIQEINKTIYFITNNIESKIVYVNNEDTYVLDNIDSLSDESTISTNPVATYTEIVSSKCLNFNINYPIHEIEYRITNKSTQIYWTDKFNPMRWLDIDEIPLVNGELDCNALRIFPDFIIPKVKIESSQDGGSLKAGAYQFFVAYANSKTEELSEYYSATNPGGVWSNELRTELSFVTTKSVKLSVTNIDTRYKYINVAVGKTLEAVTEYELIGNFDVTGETFEFVYTGNDPFLKPLTSKDIFFRYPFYNKAGTVTNQNNMLLWGDLETDPDLNYQSIASNVELLWETYRIPYSQFEGYSNPKNSSNYRGYMRDEVYAFEIAFVLKSGRITKGFHIPGRKGTHVDFENINNKDGEQYKKDPCDPQENMSRWQVYNTASLIGTSPLFDNDPCYIGPHLYGSFAYWESVRKYPNNPLWGDLAGTPIRHHKFPDSKITHIHDQGDNKISFEHSIYPIGVKVTKANIIDAIRQSSLTQEQKDNIVGFKILRANRSSNASILAKGLVYNMGTYNKDNTDYLYPNYPFNDVGTDPFLSKYKVERQGEIIPGALQNNRHEGFITDSSKKYFTFHSPDTHFKKEPISGSLKLETIEYGKTDSHFVKVDKHAKYAIGTRKGVEIATVLALSTVLSYTGGFLSVEVSINLGNFLPGFQAAFDMVKKLIPLREYAVQYNGVGNYSKYKVVPEQGNKVRTISNIGYLQPGIVNISDRPVNNFQRESSVFIKTDETLPFTHELDNTVAKDNSRFTFQKYTEDTGQTIEVGQKVQRDIASYYASIKQRKDDQYGEIYSYMTLDTGSLFYLTETDFNTVFGGDTFINRIGLKRKLPFFLSNTVGEMDETDITYNALHNVAYPNYYITTSPLNSEMSDDVKNKFADAYAAMSDTSFGAGLVGAVSGGLSRFVPALKAILALVGEVVSRLGIKDINLDRYTDKGYNEEGVFYLFAYGISYFFAESAINVDLRQAENSTDKNFFPNVGTDIPDFWLQETNVSIAKDNHYYYNRVFSKQNLENYFGHLPKDWNEEKDSITEHRTRVIYSEPASLEDNQNNWLVYRALNYHDFPYSNGKLISLRGLESEKVLARFENNMSIYNAYISFPTDNKTAITGTGSMFANPPQESFKTDIGYGGTQHHAFVSTNHGYFWLDSKRGHIFNLSSSVTEISRNGMRNFFKENLPFNIASTGAPLDNSFQGIGITMVWDNRYDRLFITKRDYKAIQGVSWVDGSFKYNGVNISLGDSTYFCDSSWTVAYSPLSESWVSFYSFTPDYYVPQKDYFQSGKYSKLWNHLLTNKSFQTYYNVLHPFEVESITKTDLNSKILSAVSFRSDVLRYENSYDWRSVDRTFNKCIISSTNQTSGLLDLDKKDKKDLSTLITAENKGNSISVPLSHVDDMWRFNKFSDVTKDANSTEPLFEYDCNNVTKHLNIDAIDYSKPFDMLNKTRLRGDWFKIKLSADRYSRYKILYKWLSDKSITSIR